MSSACSSRPVLRRPRLSLRRIGRRCGAGYTSEDRIGGIGLVNIHRRLNLLYPGQYQLDIEDTPQAYAVNLEINLDN